MLKELVKGGINLEDILHHYNANISSIKLPNKIYGFVFNYKGIYNIFVNKSLSHKKLLETILHELAHIELNHLDQAGNDLFAFYINKYEDEANEYIKLL